MEYCYYFMKTIDRKNFKLVGLLYIMISKSQQTIIIHVVYIWIAICENNMSNVNTKRVHRVLSLGSELAVISGIEQLLRRSRTAAVECIQNGSNPVFVQVDPQNILVSYNYKSVANDYPMVLILMH